MSTRCQVQIKFEGNHENDVTLYHHWDGYPENMIPLLIRAYGMGKAGIIRDYLIYNDDLSKMGKHYLSSLYSPAKAVNYVVAADPGGYEIESMNGSLKLHGDIEFLYLLWISDESWRIQCFSPRNNQLFWEYASIEQMQAESIMMSLMDAAYWVVRERKQKLLVSPIKKAK